VFCKGTKNVEYIEAFGIYGGIVSGNWYHKSCLNEVVCEPEKYATRTVDMAIDIIGRIKEMKSRKEGRTKRSLELCEYLKQHCV
jgi:hypothetical protein